MTLIKLKHIDRFRDRHGKLRYYYRAGRGSRIPLPGSPGTPEFMVAYEAAAKGVAPTLEPKFRGAPGTFDRLAQAYFSSPDFQRLAPSTQRTYRSVIERLLEDEGIGHRLVKEMTREHVQKILAKRFSTPGAANSVLQKLKVLLRFAIENGWRKDDPTLRVKKFAKGEFHTWTEDEIAAFERRWPIGTTPRLAFALLLYTGQRRSDVVGIKWSDLEGGSISVVPLKTRRTSGVRLSIPIHPALAEVLESTSKTTETLLVTTHGHAFTGNGFGNYMADKIEAAGLPVHCVTHGLRKAAARRLAEAGCSANEIASITGHATLQEVARYTKAAEQRQLAKLAIERLRAQKNDFPGPTEVLPSQTNVDGLGEPSVFPMESIFQTAGSIPLGSTNPLKRDARAYIRVRLPRSDQPVLFGLVERRAMRT